MDDYQGLFQGSKVFSKDEHIGMVRYIQESYDGKWMLTLKIFSIYNNINNDLLFKIDNSKLIVDYEGMIKAEEEARLIRKIKRPVILNENIEVDTLDLTEIDTFIEEFDSWSAAPPPRKKKSSSRKFVAYDRPPTPQTPLVPIYPDKCKKAGIEGKVVVEFYVDEVGKVDLSTVAILQSIPCLDQACIDVIKKSKWKPCKQGQEKVGVYLTKTFNFTLEQ
tara:strand:- start:278 stop:937 length:660 start_codon:yes stop_codon:yes gene_type:complete